MEADYPVCDLFSPSLQHTLAWQVLPQLCVRDLASLTCSCKAGRQLVLQAGPDAWRAIAHEALPLRHPARTSSQVGAHVLLMRLHQ